MRRWAFGFAMLFAFATAGEAAAQASFGPQLSYGTDSSLGIGVRMIAPLTGTETGIDLIGSADYFFGDEPAGVDISWIELNGGLSIPVVLSDSFRPYLGAGLNLSFVSVKFDDTTFDNDTRTRLGINLLGGWRAESMAGFIPFVEVRAVIAGEEQLVFTAGLTIGGGR